MKKINLISFLILIILSTALIIGCSPNDPIENMYTSNLYPGKGQFDIGSRSGHYINGYIDKLFTDNIQVEFIQADSVDADSLTVGGVPVVTTPSPWVVDTNGIDYKSGNIGVNTDSTADDLVRIYANSGTDDTALSVGENSANAGSIGIDVSIAGAKSGDTYGLRVSNGATSGTNNKDKYGLYVTSTSVWNGAGAVNYGIYADKPEGGTANVAGHFGDTTNYLEVADDGTLTLTGTARVYEGSWVNAGAIKAPGAKPATAIAHGALETPAWQFSDEILEANQESISFSLRIPDRMDRTVSPVLFVGWSTTTADPGDDSEQCKWRLEYVWHAENESTIIAAEDTKYALTSASTTAEGFIISTFTGINVPGSTDVCIFCRITRLSADVEDTVADDVELHGLCFRYVSDKLGSES